MQIRLFQRYQRIKRSWRQFLVSQCLQVISECESLELTNAIIAARVANFAKMLLLLLKEWDFTSLKNKLLASDGLNRNFQDFAGEYFISD